MLLCLVEIVCPTRHAANLYSVPFPYLFIEPINHSNPLSPIPPSSSASGVCAI